MVTAIFPAAGTSRRMGGKGNKNFLSLDGEPILIRTLKTFSQVDRINFLIVIVAPHEIDQVENILNYTANLKPWRVTIGGAERQYSIANGLKFVPAEAKIILVHDAARPLVSIKTINSVIDGAENFGGAIAAVPAKDTIKVIDAEDFVKCTPPRKDLVLVQTPQGFQREILFTAYETAIREKFLGTDDASLVERIGSPIKIVQGSYDNIKITTPEDISVAENILRSRNI